MEDDYELERRVSVRCAALSRRRSAGAGGDLPLQHLPPDLRRADALLRPFPAERVWTEQQLPWLRIDDDLPRFPKISAAVPSRALDD
jgi:hypothetical protein